MGFISLYDPSHYDSTNSFYGNKAPRICRGRFRYEKQLGQGGFGVVWKVYDKWLNQHVALKISSLPMGHEVGAFRKLPRDCFVDTFDYVREGDYEGYTMELIGLPWQNLGNAIAGFWKVVPRLRRSKEALGVVRVKAALLIASQFLIALGHLHGRRYDRNNRLCHGDIKPDNAWVNTNLLVQRVSHWSTAQPQFVKLGDLGLCREKGKAFGGYTELFAAPEQRSSRVGVLASASGASDVFAVGQILALIIADAPTSEDERKSKKRLDGKFDTIPSAFLKSFVVDLVRRMTYTNPLQRISGAKALREIDLLLRDSEWIVIECLANLGGTEGLPLDSAVNALFKPFGAPLGWTRKSASRIDLISETVKDMRKRGILSIKRHRYRA